MRLVRLIAAAALSLIPALVLAQGAVAPGRVPNRPSNDNSTAPANTAYVDAASQTLLNAIGSRAPLANPVFSGTVTAPSFSGGGSGLSVAVPGSLIARTLSRRFAEVVNVGDYASCDGSTDVVAQIRAAAAEASPRRPLFFPPMPADCVLGDSFTVASGVTVYGVPGTVVLRQGPANTKGLFYVTNASGVRVQGLTLDGGGQDHISKSALVTVFQSSGVDVDNVTFRNSRWVGANFSKVNRSGVRNSRFVNIGNHWRTTSDPFDRQQALTFCCGTTAENVKNYAIDNYFEDIGLDPISMGNATDATITGNRCEITNDQISRVSHGEYAGCIYTTDVNGVSITSNYSRGATGNSIDIHNTRNYVVAGNVIKNSGSAGIGVFSSAGSVTGNAVINAALWPTSPFKGAISFSGPLTGVTVTGNTLIDDQAVPTTQYGFHLYSGSLTDSRIDQSNTVSGIAARVSDNLAATIAAQPVTGAVDGGTILGRTLLARARDVMNVKDHGAIGDGLADDTAAIAAAVAAASSRAVLTDTYGASLPGVCFPGGTYKTTGFDIPGGRFVLRPCAGGWGSVTLRLADGANRSLIRVLPVGTGTVKANFAFPTVEGLILNGNRVNQTAASHCLEFQNDPTPSFTEYHRAGLVKDLHALECRDAGVYVGMNRNGLEAINLWAESNTSSLVLHGFDNQIINSGMGHSSGPVVDFRVGGSTVFMNTNLYGGGTGMRLSPMVEAYVMLIGGSIDGNRQGAMQIYANGTPADTKDPLYISDVWAYNTLFAKNWTPNTPSAWASSTAYTVGQRRLNNRELYEVTTAGTSASSGAGPAGKGSSIADGGVTWRWVQSSADRFVTVSHTSVASNALVGDGNFPAILLLNGASVTVNDSSFNAHSATFANLYFPGGLSGDPYYNRYNYLVQQGGNGFGKVYWSNNSSYALMDNAASPISTAMFSHPENVVGTVLDMTGGQALYQPRLTVGTSGSTSTSVTLNGAASSNRALAYQTAGTARAIFGVSADAETGGNAGSNPMLQTYNDAGTLLRQDLLINRADGTWNIAGVVKTQASAVFGGNASSYTTVYANGAAGTGRGFGVNTGGLSRWQVVGDGAAETGGNAGTNLQINAFNDAGVYISTPISVSRSTGTVTLGALLALKGYTVAGLPTCNMAARDTMAVATDAAAPTYRGALTGGGTVRTPVYCDGAAWTAH